MRHLLLTIIMFTSAASLAETLTASWDESVTYEDGSLIPPGIITYYVVHEEAQIDVCETMELACEIEVAINNCYTYSVIAMDGESGLTSVPSESVNVCVSESKRPGKIKLRVTRKRFER